MYKCFSRGLLDSNVYVVWDEESREAMIVDAGCRVSEISEFVSKKRLSVKYIVLTHAHYDHAHFAGEYKRCFEGAELCAHAKEIPVFSDYEANVSIYFGTPTSYDLPDKKLAEGSALKLGETEFKVLSTPGHTPGSICLFCESEKLMLTGDTLFMYGRGRTDFKYGSEDDISASLARLLAMDGDILFLSGHGAPSYIKNERGRMW